MKYLPLALLAILLFTGLANAQSTNQNTCSGQDFLTTLSNLPGCIVSSFFSFIVSGLVASVQGLINASFKFMFASPDPTSFCNPYNAVIAVLETLFSLALMGLALMFIVRSNDVEGRIAAKKWLENLIVLIVLLAFSFMIFQTLLSLNTYLTTSFANNSLQNYFTPTTSFSSAIFAVLILLCAIALLGLTCLTLLLRYILIPFLLLAFPIALFLYFIPPTKSWGKAFLKIIVIIIFMTTLDSIILLGLSSLFASNDPNLANATIQGLAVLFGFAIIGFANIALFALAIQTGVSEAQTIVNHPVVSAATRLMNKGGGK